MNNIFTEEQLLENRQQFIDTLKQVDRQGIDNIIEYLDNSDFFEGPATSLDHGNFTGGLCFHSLSVYNAIKQLYQVLSETSDQVSQIDEDSLIISALLHDIGKVNTYVKDVKNKKFYSDAGSKKDQMGRYDWVSEPYFAKREDRALYCSDEVTSEFIAHSFVPLTYEESVAILHSSGGKAWDSAQYNVAEVFSKHPLALLLHEADLSASYIAENPERLVKIYGDNSAE